MRPVATSPSPVVTTDIDGATDGSSTSDATDVRTATA